jgi:hypothetical protein
MISMCHVVKVYNRTNGVGCGTVSREKLLRKVLQVTNGDMVTSFISRSILNTGA